MVRLLVARGSEAVQVGQCLPLGRSLGTCSPVSEPASANSLSSQMQTTRHRPSPSLRDHRGFPTFPTFPNSRSSIRTASRGTPSTSTDATARPPGLVASAEADFDCNVATSDSEPDPSEDLIDLDVKSAPSGSRDEMVDLSTTGAAPTADDKGDDLGDGPTPTVPESTASRSRFFGGLEGEEEKNGGEPTSKRQKTEMDMPPFFEGEEWMFVKEVILEDLRIGEFAILCPPQPRSRKVKRNDRRKGNTTVLTGDDFQINGREKKQQKLLPAKMWWSPELRKILGMDKKMEVSDLSVYGSIVDKCDKEKVAEKFRLACVNGIHFQMSHRVMLNGVLRWVHIKCKTQRFPTGFVYLVYGTVQDITRWRQAIEDEYKSPPPRTSAKGEHEIPKNSMQILSSELRGETKRSNKKPIIVEEKEVEKLQRLQMIVDSDSENCALS
ncbi:hypothetical protein AAMO2058_000362000 [Amorphochlora amoebiformis]